MTSLAIDVPPLTIAVGDTVFLGQSNAILYTGIANSGTLNIGGLGVGVDFFDPDPASPTYGFTSYNEGVVNVADGSFLYNYGYFRNDYAGLMNGPGELGNGVFGEFVNNGRIQGDFVNYGIFYGDGVVAGSFTNNGIVNFGPDAGPGAVPDGSGKFPEVPGIALVKADRFDLDSRGPVALKGGAKRGRADSRRHGRSGMRRGDVGEFDVNGSFTQKNSAKLAMDMRNVDQALSEVGLSIRHDRLNVQGDVRLRGDFELSMPENLFMKEGDSLVVIGVGGALKGRFAGLREGSTVDAITGMGGVPLDLRITYQGGDGNDVGIYAMARN